ncbi:L-type lectin-domain containing receptor kinase IX.1-like [Papaver somniferum]|uniref:L-type lectin-domain containing receptor kinase IX.1-like n=1 Tax=Papaver somniferum TaxID=3469 RepID=UPI000E6F787E|nr:L-type lectin-domain containing receptor kinase IX.1-like [Papaver somniferum]
MAFFCKPSTTPQLHSSIFFFLILLLPNTTNSVSFNIPGFQQDDPRIRCEGDSHLGHYNEIELTGNSADCTTNSVGRAAYSEPIQLWDSKTGMHTNFDTHFSFIIKSKNRAYGNGNGITFFLAPFGSPPTPDSRIVEVEFVSFKDEFDHYADQVGIKINPDEPVAMLANSIMDGRQTNAWVRYNATTNNLTVYLTPIENPDFSDKSTLYHIVDLSKVLPEQITVGFMATSFGIQSLKVISWQFNGYATTSFGIKSHKMVSWQFYSSPKIGKSISIRFVAGLVIGIGGTCALIFIFLLIWLTMRRGNKQNNEEETTNSEVSMDNEFENGTGPKRFWYTELVHATNNFDEGGKLGQGGFGGVYKGFLSDLSLNVAVKRVSRGSKQGKKEYKSEVKIISKLRHRNLVQLVGWCHERNELLLVYEFMPNRSLDNHLFRAETLLTWNVRYKIALGLASALLYLHEEWEQCVLHRDIKSSNVMLDSNFNAKLGDFGLARLVDHGLGSQTTKLAGTIGYLAPECFLTRKSSKESDVFSFGIVALEIACGRKPDDATPGLSLVEWVWGLYGRGRIGEAADGRLNMEFNEIEMEKLLVVGLWCAHPDYKSRPSATQVINVLKFEFPLPNLPLEFPTPVYLPPSPGVLDLPSFASFSDTITGR